MGLSGKGWPDWRGQTVLIAASGPSQNREDIEAARGKAKVVVINETWRLAPWADALYACDERWWRLRAPSDNEFRGLRLIGKGEWPGCTPCGVMAGEQGPFWCRTRLGAGGNSGYQALNLAAACGARRIILTGYDMQHTGGRKHHHEDHGPGMSNPDAKMLERCASYLDGVAGAYAARGVEVLNASRETALRAFPRVKLQEVL